MSEERFRLVFRGELLEGHREASVRSRLAAALGLEADRAASLFSGRPVVVKRDVDRATAVRYREVCREAGAHLRVAPEAPGEERAAAAGRTQGADAAVSADDAAAPLKRRRHGGSTLAERLGRDAALDAGDSHASAPLSNAASAQAPPPHDAATRSAQHADAPAFELAPVGSDVLRADERPRVATPDVDVSHLSASLPEDGGLEPGRPAPPPPPDTSGLSLVEPDGDDEAPGTDHR